MILLRLEKPMHYFTFCGKNNIMDIFGERKGSAESHDNRATLRDLLETFQYAQSFSLHFFFNLFIFQPFYVSMTMKSWNWFLFMISLIGLLFVLENVMRLFFLFIFSKLKIGIFLQISKL